ncbi:hypothetical protein A2526_00685 [candidate division WOR-1 bacterium RIFOXYD2_FULL_36_8]|uniref:tRNA-specific adenosine deaminase n=1 Tax=candidate division WOR-1 bacterium RIFOXYB2_FULL_36_35 TaxID=1802578 RepID=A0A1F4S317_UNCSA|nr:MAG: hypothetical protein A2230_06875 [candidate division WOR-1 bacterium RIFOXYA2_FULL_36_21]OGC14846.1 MAG: hypothetical protein A2290_00950 [candidate division WOR-1 bacterium RIFOXYB2_FULL_36_35]OGC15598.1 MAG: hypothetical protein A2282_09195 [candidate division WOR-1 bacterium RIFOXYA12_FULL_36_13]OGC41703.1 MAG: hypothetical protein A2526_00685 [candidate division WOR-1 bacterium RIFOXYD2_FULL_36_8]
MKALQKWMKEAVKEAKKAYKKEEVPIGCIAVLQDKIIAKAHNVRETKEDPLAHAELLCIRRAAKKLGEWHLNDITLYTTLEPCLMCAGAIIHAKIRNVVIGTSSPDNGAGRLLRKHNVKLTKGILKEECGKILKDFFKRLRMKEV